MAERTGCPVLLNLWSYVVFCACAKKYIWYFNTAKMEVPALESPPSWVQERRNVERTLNLEKA